MEYSISITNKIQSVSEKLSVFQFLLNLQYLLKLDAKLLISYNWINKINSKNPYFNREKPKKKVTIKEKKG